MATPVIRLFLQSAQGLVPKADGGLGGNGGSGNEEENEGVMWLPPSRSFHAGLCYKCQKISSKGCPLKLCAQCNLVSYCSRACQKKDWSAHKPFCNMYAVKNGRSIFSEVKYNMRSQEAFVSFLYLNERKATLVLGRCLESHEREIFWFPKLCNVCLNPDVKSTVECYSCHSVFYCTNAHFVQDLKHKEFCKSYALCIECDVLEYDKGVPDFCILKNVDDQYCRLPEMKTVLMSHVKSSKEPNTVILCKTLRVILSERLSYPLSILYSLQHLKLGPFQQLVGEVAELRIHVVGAVEANELKFMAVWEYLMHRLPRLKKLHLVFIGPQLFYGLDNEIPLSERRYLENGGVIRCEHCKNKSREIIYEVCQMKYHTYCTQQFYLKPDAIVAFHGKFFTDAFDAKVVNNIPVIVTADTEPQMFEIITALQKRAVLEMVIYPHVNPYQSLRPHRNPNKREDTEIQFSNQYLFCVKIKGLKVLDFFRTMFLAQVLRNAAI